MDFVEICKVYVGKMIIKAAKRIFNYDKVCRSYDMNFGVTFLEHSVYTILYRPTIIGPLILLLSGAQVCDVCC